LGIRNGTTGPSFFLLVFRLAPEIAAIRSRPEMGRPDRPFVRPRRGRRLCSGSTRRRRILILCRDGFQGGGTVGRRGLAWERPQRGLENLHYRGSGAVQNSTLVFFSRYV